MRWMKCEYFYSWVERPYYIKSSFKALLAKLGFDESTSTSGSGFNSASGGGLKLNTVEWSLVRQTLCGEGKKPRRFSEALISDEKKEL